MLAGLLYAGVQRRGFGEVLGLSRLELRGDEYWLLPAAILSSSLLLLLPGVVLAHALLRRGHPRGSRRAFVGLSSAACWLLLLDLDILRSVGRHLSEVATVALLPEGHIAGGAVSEWLGRVSLWGLVAIILSYSVSVLCERLVAAATARLSPLLGGVLHAALWVSCVGLLAIPHLMEQGWRSPALFERAHAALLLDPRMGRSATAAEHADPQLGALYPRLRRAYEDAFLGFTSGKPATPVRLDLPPRPPNVVLIVAESLRHDVFGAELMPRLTAWADQGLVATRHDSGTMYSESGMFSLLYGRSPAVYHQTLDARVPPELCVTLRASGYECAYFTGHPEIWMRREEFLNPETMDHFVHDDSGTWPEWDQRALDAMVEHVHQSEKPVFAIVLLMSSHFEYQYPAKYEIDRPVSTTAWRVSNPRALGPEAEVPHRNRYRNCMRFVDDLVADAIGQLTPAQNLVVFTGDHGESLHDDGRYTHGYSFSEITTRTPLAMVGPQIAPLRLDRPTSHVDVLPTLLHALTGASQPAPRGHGIDWLADEARSSSLEAHSPPGKREVRAQLRSGGFRLRLDLSLERPWVTLLGFEDEKGHLVPTPSLTEVDTEALAAAFEDHLALLRH